MSRTVRWFERLAASRGPDFIIGGTENPYMLRWWVIPKNRFFNIYLHKFLRSDDDRALHDHPWWNLSYILDGAYTEETIAAGGVHKRVLYEAGSVRFRRAKSAHRVELTHGSCWSLFVTGPIIRQWGFHCPQGWRHWKDFVSLTDPGQPGKGCD